MAAEAPKPAASGAQDIKVEADDVGLDAIGDDEKIKLKSCDGKVFEVNKKAAFMSKLIRSAFSTDTATQEIDLKHIEGETIQHIIKFLEYHAKVPCKEIPKPLPDEKLEVHAGEWDAKFADVDQDTMFKVLLAANFMDIQPLLMLMCAKVASLMKNKTPEEIRKTFNLRAEYTPEEEERAKKEYKDLLE